MIDAFELAAAICRRGLIHFAIRAMVILEPNTRLTINWHHRAIAYELERCWRGEVRRLVVNQPPKTLKTHLISISFVAWLLMRDPTLKIAIISYDEELASTQLRKLRQLLRSRWFRGLAPQTRINKEKDTEIHFETTAGGEVRALSIQGGITGHGFDYIFIDDPQKASLAHSETERRNLEELYSSTIANRWRNPNTGVLVVVMQRLHIDDFTAFLLRARPDTVHLSIPAKAPCEMSFAIGPGIAHRFKEGQLLEPERLSERYLGEMRSLQGAVHFEAQYLQAPTITGGRIVETAWFRNLAAPREPDYTIVSIDPAFTEGGGNFSAALVANFVGDDIELVHGEQVQFEYPRLGRWIRDLDKAFEPDVFVIEAIGAGLGLPAYLESFKIDHVATIGSHGRVSKTERMEIVSPKIEAGRVWLPKSDAWAAQFLRIISEFPHGTSDDWPDALSQLLFYRDRIKAEARLHRDRRFPPEPPPDLRPYMPRGIHYRRFDYSW